MGLTLLAALLLLPLFLPKDPAPGLTTSRTESRQRDCERLNETSAERLYPWLLHAEGPQADNLERDVMRCWDRLMRPGLRAPRDEAILSKLQARTVELARAARAIRPELSERTWLVEAHYPDAQIAYKITFATQNALLAEGLQVTDRAPTLAVGDVRVIASLPPEQAYDAACRRYAELGSVGDDEALLAVMIRDHRETNLHAGVCASGRWAWLQ